MCGENPDTQTPDVASESIGGLLSGPNKATGQPGIQTSGDVASTVAGDFNTFRDYASKHMDETSPMLEENISKQQKLMEESLSRKLGSNWRNTTPGIQAVSEFERNANIQREEDRMNRMNSLVSNYSTLAGTALQPYLADKQYAHDLSLTGMMSDAQKRSDLMGLVGNVGGMGLYGYLMGNKTSDTAKKVGQNLLTGDNVGNGGGGGGGSTGVTAPASTLLNNSGSAASGLVAGDVAAPVVGSEVLGPEALGSGMEWGGGYGLENLPSSVFGGAGAGAGAETVGGLAGPAADEFYSGLSAGAGTGAGTGAGAGAGISGATALTGIGAAIAAPVVLGPPITSWMKKTFGSGQQAPKGGDYLNALTGGPQTKWTQSAQSQWNNYLANAQKGLTTRNSPQMIASWIADSVFNPTQYDEKAALQDPIIMNLAQRIANGEVTNAHLPRELDKVKMYSSNVWRDPTAH